MAMVAAKVRVTLTVEVDAHGEWAVESTLNHIHNAATDSVLKLLGRGCGANDWSVVGKPMVQTIVTFEVK